MPHCRLKMLGGNKEREAESAAHISSRFPAKNQRGCYTIVHKEKSGETGKAVTLGQAQGLGVGLVAHRPWEATSTSAHFARQLFAYVLLSVPHTRFNSCAMSSEMSYAEYHYSEMSFAEDSHGHFGALCTAAVCKSPVVDSVHLRQLLRKSEDMSPTHRMTMGAPFSRLPP